MIAAIDIETYGLEATPEAFCLGCIMDENGNISIHNNSTNMWKNLIEIAKRAYSSKSPLKVYAHNMGNYDFNILFPRDRLYQFEILSVNPCIYKYIENGKRLQTFLDTMAIFKMSLAEAAKLIGMEKGETPDILKKGDRNIDEKTKELIKQYLIQDTKICLNLILKIRQKLTEYNINIRNITTISQIAIQVMLNAIKKEKQESFFYIEDKNMLIWTKYPQFIHMGYKGARTECFKYGAIQHANHIDINSLYPHAAMLIPFPDLNKDGQQMISKPLNAYGLKILDNIGVSLALLRNNSCELGYLPITTPTFSLYPKKGKYLIGVWTNLELKKAIREGYDIIDIEKTAIFGQSKTNPFKNIMRNLYAQRISEKDPFNRWFFKQIMNHPIGKFGQIRAGQHIIIDSIEETEKYIKKGYMQLQGIKNSTNIMYRKTTHQRKPYYCPIIPAYVCAMGRTIMFNYLKRFDTGQLVYTDTDSIIYTGENKVPNMMGDEMGKFKIVNVNQDALIWGRKTYSIGEDIKMSGVHKSDLNMEGFREGTIEQRKITSLLQTNDMNEIGKLKTIKRDLKEQLETNNRQMEMLDELDIYIDNDVNEIPEGFLKALRGNGKI